jgi:hypothetical protein
MLVAPASGRADTVKDPNAIPCPGPPSGWSALPVVKNVRTPTTVSTALPESYTSGGNLVSITCTYFASEGNRTNVVVNYALPTDPNPAADFNLGCGKGDAPWSPDYRVSRVASIEQWAYAMFTNPLNPLSGRDVSSFTSVARRLLGSVNGYGHPCNVDPKPTTVISNYIFDFTLAKKRVETIFWIEPTTQHSGVYPIQRVIATPFQLGVMVNGTGHTLTLAFAKGIDFQPAKGKFKDRARFTVRVVRSPLQSCRKGTTGTLTVTAQPSIALALCGASVAGTGSLTGVHFRQQ